MVAGDPDYQRTIDLHLDTFDLATNFVVASVEVGQVPPEQIALTVKRLEPPVGHASPDLHAVLADTNATPSERLRAMRARTEALRARTADEQVDWDRASWMPFTNSLPIDLGPGEGRRVIWIAAKWATTHGRFQRASATHVRVRYSPPVVTVTNPPGPVVFRPMIQLQGYTDEPVQRLRYDVLNASSGVVDAQGLVNDQYHDPVLFEFTTNYFTCYDIELAPGTNTIVLRCEDLAGNIATNRLTYVFKVDPTRPPPSLTVDDPRDGERIGAGAFTVRGRLDDPTARLTALVYTDRETNTFQGLVERDGYYWVENIPLGAGANHVAVTATDVAGNSSQTNLVVYKGEQVITIDSIPVDQLWQGHVTVTGRVTPGHAAVWVNGVQGHVSPDGTWIATRVPVLSPNGGTAVFEAGTAPPPGESRRTSGARPSAAPTNPEQLTAVVAALSTNALTLNAGQPSCGAFLLWLYGATGRSFILSWSTNLVEWVPVLTNRSSPETFTFTDTNVAGSNCRFFRLSPLP